MPFKAATDGECVKCHRPIYRGDLITWKRTGPQAGRYHILCPSETPSTVKLVYDVATDLHVPAELAIAPVGPPAATDPEPAPATVEPEPVSEPVATNDGELELAPELVPGTRAWLRAATVADRESYLLAKLTEPAPMTMRQWTKLVARVTANLTDKQARRFVRWARGVWTGVTLRVETECDPWSRDQLELFSEPVDTTHGEMVMGWRNLLQLWGA